jgi:hypothetical protein
VTLRTRTAALLAAAFASLPATAGAAPYTAERAPYRATVHFTASYDGIGLWRTVFHATPPNPGGDPDTNDARDASAQSWHLRFRRDLVVPACGGDPDPCSGVSGQDEARGATRLIGYVNHTHVDGLYDELDRTVKCTIDFGTEASDAVAASFAVKYSAASEAFALRTHDPLTDVFTNMPGACPDQGEPIDRILDNYFTPGFSFASAYGPDRWFASRAVALPKRVLHHSKTIAIPFRPTPAGTPPADCAVENPSYEQCTTGGGWYGTLTLRRKPA